MGKRCKHGHRGKSWGQAWSPKRGFVYEDELRFATEVHCMICGAVLDEPLPSVESINRSTAKAHARPPRI